MQPFSTAELGRMQGAQDSAMMDTCFVLVYTAGAVNAYNKPTITYPASAATRCGWKPATKELMQDTQVPAWDGSLRMPINTVVKNTDRIRLTHRYGVALSPAQDHEIIGNPERGPSGLVLRLKSLTDGS